MEVEDSFTLVGWCAGADTAGRGGGDRDVCGIVDVRGYIEVIIKHSKEEMKVSSVVLC